MLLRGEKFFQPIIQGNESTLPMGPLGEFFKELSFGELGLLFIINKARSSFIADKFAAQTYNAHLRLVGVNKSC